jgi:hypothetical protein
VTLGHELGHTANMRAAAANIGKKAHTHLDLITAMSGGNEEAGKRWDNAEELINIENIENALRQESGQTQRQGHQLARWAQPLVKQVRDQLFQLYDFKQMDFKDGEYTNLYEEIRTLPAKDTFKQDKVQEVQTKIENFVNNRIATALPRLLRLVSDKTKATALQNALPDKQAKINTTAYLPQREADGKLKAIKKLLHFGYKRRKGTTKITRAQTRVQILAQLVNGQLQV